jgi:hypothetical protein
MPYIIKAQRKTVDPAIDALAEAILKAAQGEGMAAAGPAKADGVLNYAYTRLMQKTLLAHDMTYASLERAIGVLECAKLEMYRRMVAPYENVKANQNGDVFDYVKGGQLNAEK